MKKQDWTKDLKSKLSDYQAPIPEGLWDDIEASLPQAQTGGHRVVMMPWRKLTAAAAIALALMGGGAYWWHHYGVQPEPAPVVVAQGTPDGASPVSSEKMNAQEAMKPDAVEIEAAEDGNAPLLAVASPAVRRANPSRTTAQSGSAVQSKPAAQPEPDAPSKAEAQSSAEAQSTPELQPKQVDDADMAQNGEKQPSTDASRSEKSRMEQNTPGNAQTNDNLATVPDLQFTAPSGKRNDPMAIGLFASNDAISFITSAPVIDYAMTNASYFDDEENGEKSYQLSNYLEKTKHHHPISVGLQLKFGLARNLALSTGLVYTYLKSDYIYEMGSTTLERNQVLQYMGVPVSVIYNFWSKYGFSAYATAGAQADFCVKATLESEGAKKDIDKDRVQFSGMVGLGLQYNFIPSLGLYVEPSLKYYFENGSKLDNAYKDRPTNIGFQFGLRYNFDK